MYARNVLWQLILGLCVTHILSILMSRPARIIKVNTLIGVYGGWHNTQVSCLHMVTVRDATSTYPLLEKCCAYWTLRGVGTKRFLCGRQYFLLRGSGTFWVLSCVHDLNMKCVLSRIFRTQCISGVGWVKKPLNCKIHFLTTWKQKTAVG